MPWRPKSGELIYEPVNSKFNRISVVAGAFCDAVYRGIAQDKYCH